MTSNVHLLVVEIFFSVNNCQHCLCNVIIIVVIIIIISMVANNKHYVIFTLFRLP